MVLNSVETVVETLNAAGVRYLVAGGLAVVAHGFVRFTADVDLILDPDPGNLRRVIEALASLGYRPRAPVRFEEFAEAENRARWVREKGLTVLSVNSAEHPATEIDLFVEPPLDFASAWEARATFEIVPGVTASFVGFEQLLELKRRAGRPQDLQDVEQLERLRRKP